MLNSFIRGLRLGIILQLSIGPVCLFILQTAIARGITEALKAVLAVVLVDAFYILLALYGLGTCLKNYPGIQKKLRYCGAAVLLYFAVTALADVFHPQISTATIMLPQISSFYAAGLLTLSNPLLVRYAFSTSFPVPAQQTATSFFHLWLYKCNVLISLSACFFR